VTLRQLLTEAATTLDPARCALDPPVSLLPTVLSGLGGLGKDPAICVITAVGPHF
jgi:hypothetical protein